MKTSFPTLAIAAISAVVAIAAACGSTSPAQNLYDKYGGAEGVKRMVDHFTDTVLADCVTSPFFIPLGTPGHISHARLRSCLRLQFTVVLGGPANYPGVNDQGEMCTDMTSIHSHVGIPGGTFDRFVADVAHSLRGDGVTDEDLNAIGATFGSLRSQIVSNAPVDRSLCR